MPHSVTQDILDALTDVAMPRLPPEPAPDRMEDHDGATIPIYETGCLVVGSGAAGLRAAVEAARRDTAVTILSQSAWGGTSACSGSDKQTLHTANTAAQGDDLFDMAQALRAGGAMDEDTAYVEAVGSARAMASLQYLGLPLPQDPLGGSLRYQTDHDEAGRATSCGPRTSRLMVKVLAEEALRLKIPFHNQTTALSILRTNGRAVGILAFRAKAIAPDNPSGLVAYLAPTVVLAAGGPGELYRDSVFPNGCFGTLGMALEAGIEAVNLTESQFGISTRREGFPWNLSGTYVQAIPHIYSLDADGQEHAFLTDYYRTTQELASNIFRKGYQWPFHATRMLDFGSSLVDLAIVRETERGRRVFMDFNRNPITVPGDAAFDLSRLDDDVALYLTTAGATQTLPIDRLRHMNPLAIELYRRYKIDIAAEPLEFSVNNQHMNGGLAVDTWGRTSLPGVYAVGEAAGTHGVTRPGGSALNAGQVFGTRVGEHIGARDLQAARQVSPQTIRQAVRDLLQRLDPASPLTPKAVRAQVQQTMSDRAGIFCTADGVATGLETARNLTSQIKALGMAPTRPAETGRAIQWQQMALVSEAVLTALDTYIRNGGGSRGARAICDPTATERPLTRTGPLESHRFRPERDIDKSEQLVVRYTGSECRVERRANRPFDQSHRSFFERDWPNWLTGEIFDLEGSR